MFCYSVKNNHVINWKILSSSLQQEVLSIEGAFHTTRPQTCPVRRLLRFVRRENFLATPKTGSSTVVVVAYLGFLKSEILTKFDSFK